MRASGENGRDTHTQETETGGEVDCRRISLRNKHSDRKRVSVCQFVFD